MSNIGPVADIRLKAKVIENCWQYVYENFHKFNEHNKIKITLAIITKDMPTQLVGDIGGTKVIIVKDKDKNAADSRSVAVPEEIPR